RGGGRCRPGSGLVIIRVGLLDLALGLKHARPPAGPWRLGFPRPAGARARARARAAAVLLPLLLRAIGPPHVAMPVALDGQQDYCVFDRALEALVVDGYMQPV